MISDQDIQRATEAGANFKPAITACKYDPESDRVELITAWCVIAVDRKCIDELRDIPPGVMKGIYASQFGVHVDEADVDINAAGLIADIGRRLEAAAAAAL